MAADKPESDQKGSITADKPESDQKDSMATDKPGPHPQEFVRARWLFLGAAAVSLVCLAVIIYIWYRVYNAPPTVFPGETLMANRDDIKRFLDATVPPINVGEGPYYIPTGIAVQSLEFKGPYTIQVAGYIWQRYADNLPELDKGIVFPEADTTTMTKVYETKQGNETLIGWNFKTTLREYFDYAKYPLDRQHIWIRLWHVDFERNVYLEPDADGYTSIEPSTSPGIDPGVVLENWQIERSYFSYRLNRYNANFGIQGYDSQQPQPEMYFNISIKRLILSPLVARGLAPLIILLQLFVIIMVIAKDSKLLEQFGVRPGAVIFTCAAFFFAILLAQNALRDEIKWFGIVYLETLHVLTYFVIVAVALNSVALVAFPQLDLFRRENLWVKVFYWPTIMVVLLVITLTIFS